MKNLVFVLLVLVAGISAFGIYRGWFIMNRQKIEQDENAAKSEIRDLEQKVKTK